MTIELIFITVICRQSWSIDTGDRDIAEVSFKTRPYGRLPLSVQSKWNKLCQECHSLCHFIPSIIVIKLKPLLRARISDYSRLKVRKADVQQADDIYTTFRKSVVSNHLACDVHKYFDPLRLIPRIMCREPFPLTDFEQLSLSSRLFSNVLRSFNYARIDYYFSSNSIYHFWFD